MQAMASLVLGEWVCLECLRAIDNSSQCAGYPMAKNLRAKIAESDTMFIHDVNPATTEQFAKEVGNVEIGKNVRDVAEKTVCQITSIRACYVLHAFL